MNINVSYTKKGSKQYKTTTNPLLDFFVSSASQRYYAIGENNLIELFLNAYKKDKYSAIKLLFWLRDIRSGAGERKLFNNLLRFLSKHSPEFVINNFSTIVKYGYWKDLLLISDIKEIKNSLVEFWATTLINKTDNLAFKWTPRLNSKYSDFAKLLRDKLGLSNSEYRKFLKQNSNTVEQLMCQNRWSEIKYSTVPSIAMRNYIEAFKRRDEKRFLEYINNKNEKINVKVLYPYDIIKIINRKTKEEVPDEIIEKMWSSLPNYIKNNSKRILVILDTSGSMCGINEFFPIAPIEVGASLAIYLSERLNGKFKNLFLTFSEKPKFVKLNESLTLRQKFSKILSADWGNTTNFESAYKLILNYAIKNSIPNSEMPEILLVISDMQFDPSMEGKETMHLNNIKKLFKENGYTVPSIIFWNVSENFTGVPIINKSKNVAMISGFSPNILENIINGEKINPMELLYKTIEKYDDIVFKGLQKLNEYIKKYYN